MSADRSFYLVKKFYKGYHGEDDLFDEEATISFYGTSDEVSAFIVSKTSDEDRARKNQITENIRVQEELLANYKKKLALQSNLSRDEQNLLGLYPNKTEIQIANCEREIWSLKVDLGNSNLRPNDAYWVEEEDRTFRNWSIVDGKIVINY